MKNLRDLRKGSQWLGSTHSKQLDKIQGMLKGMEVVENQIDALGSNPKHIESLHAKLDSLKEYMGYLSTAGKLITKEQAMLSSLNFESREMREYAICDAHHSTFEWTFEERVIKDRSGCSMDLFQWMKQDNGIFWVSGKPGSGKSTFMKFVSRHLETARALRLWSHPQPVFIASYFFWSSGTDMQKSLQGLLRSLLFDVFSNFPELMPISCPGRFSTPDSRRAWGIAELQNALRMISAEAILPSKLCFFIDGLDEYEGDHMDFCSDLKKICSTANLKICISSRPWNVFEDAFGQDPLRKGYLHHLTRNDIRNYSRQRLENHPRWNVVISQTSKAVLLIEDIIERARGVFLWVFLVTKLLREGLTNDDSYSDLQKRLQSFPVDLEPFFKQMLDSVEPFYHQKMAQTLQIAVAARKPLNALIYSFHDQEGDDEDYPLHLPIHEALPESIDIRRIQITRRINGRCRGLLEEHKHHIHFLHRTVRDFLMTREMADYISQKSGSEFIASFSILKAYTAWTKSNGVFSNPSTTLADRLRDAFQYVPDLEESSLSKSRLDGYIDEMDAAVVHKINRGDEHSLSSSSLTGLEAARRVTRTIMLEVDVFGFLSRKFGRDPNYFEMFNEPAIYVVLRHPTVGEALWPNQAFEHLSYLLKSGQNPNDPVSKDFDGSTLFFRQPMTIWTGLLTTLMPGQCGRVDLGKRFLWSLINGFITLFLRHGADPNARLFRKSQNGFCTSSAWVDFLMLSFKVPCSYAEAYLETLDAFIQYGAKFGAEPVDWKHAIDAKETPTASHVTQSVTIDGEFFTHLRNVKDRSPPRLSLLANVITRLIPKGYKAGWPLDTHFPVIDKLMPSYLQRKIMEVWPKAEQGKQTKNKGKRRRQIGADGKARKKHK